MQPAPERLLLKAGQAVLGPQAPVLAQVLGSIVQVYQLLQRPEADRPLLLLQR